MCELTQKWYNDGVKMATANDLISIMDSFKVSIESAMQTLKVPETEKVFYVALVDNIRSGKVKSE